MCGIVYTKRKKQSRANKTILKRFQKQRLRGLKGFGYIPVENGKVIGVKRFEQEAEMIQSIKEETTDEILFHHRYPTSTPNISEVNHPISVKSKLLKRNYYVVHNGVLQNDSNLREEHMELGFNYTTDMTKEESYTVAGKTKITTQESFYNDSEALAIDLALYLEGKQESLKSKGSIAFICFETNKKNKILNIHYGHNDSNPLVLEENKGMFVLKSEGNGIQLETDVLMTMDYKTKKITKNDLDIGVKKEKAGFDTTQHDNDSYPYDKYHKNDKYLDDDVYQRMLQEADYDESAEKYYASEYNADYDEYERVEDEIDRVKVMVKDLERDIETTEKFVSNNKTSEIYNEEVLEELKDNKIELEIDLIDFENELSNLENRLGGGN